LREAPDPAPKEPRPVARSVAQPTDFTLPEAFIKTVDHFVPEFWRALASVKDFRHPLMIAYPIEMELLIGLLMFVTKVGSRRSVKYKLGTPAFAANLQILCEQLFPKTWRPYPDCVPHGDTLNYLLKGVAPREIHVLRRLVVRSLLRKRALESFRLLGRYYPVAVDGTGQLVFREKHCGRCVREVHEGYTLYKHPVVEAKLALQNGFALSVGTAFVENLAPDADKQDCESRGFQRLAKDLKRDFPMLDICLLLDGLFANRTVIRLCKGNRWAYIITFKEGSLPAVWEEYQALKRLAPKDVLVEEAPGCRRTYRWVNDIDFDGLTVNAFECIEETAEGVTPFVWLTSLPVSKANVAELAVRGGRLRWKIENEGFNTQKNGGYELEHAYSTDPTAMKNFYLLLQVGHLISQLMEKGSLLRKRIQETMGSLRTFSQRLWAALTETLLDLARLREILGTRIQIRFDSG
jgi:hypothetical protein